MRVRAFQEIDRPLDSRLAERGVRTAPIEPANDAVARASENGSLAW